MKDLRYSGGNDLSHYTSLSAAHSILKSRSIRFTDYRFLNDISEFNYASKKFIDIFSDERMKVFAKKTIEILMKYKIGIFSFCKNRNSLPHFISYADDARGVCINFNKQELIRGLLDKNKIKLEAEFDTKKPFLKFSDFLTVKYDFEDFTESNLLKNFDWLLKNSFHFSDFKIKLKDGANERFINELLKLISFLLSHKQSSFSFENEVRIVAFTNLNNLWDTEVRRELIIPHLNLEFESNRIFNGYDIGPKCDERNQEQLKRYITINITEHFMSTLKNGKDKPHYVIHSKSDIPYR